MHVAVDSFISISKGTELADGAQTFIFLTK